MHWCPEFAFCGAKSSKLGNVPSLKDLRPTVRRQQVPGSLPRTEVSPPIAYGSVMPPLPSSPTLT